MNNSAFDIGKKGEDFFTEKLVNIFFKNDLASCLAGHGIYSSDRPLMDNVTKCKVEGDFMLIDGTIIEVKTACDPAPAEGKEPVHYDNVLIEFAKGDNKKYPGWYQHCKNNGVEYIVWNRYRSVSDPYPAYSILVFFPALSAYVDPILTPARLAKRRIIRNFQIDSDGIRKPFYCLPLHCHELFYYAQCVQMIAYPLPHEQSIPDVLSRSELPPWNGLVADPIRIPLKQ